MDILGDDRERTPPPPYVGRIIRLGLDGSKIRGTRILSIVHVYSGGGTAISSLDFVRKASSVDPQNCVLRSWAVSSLSSNDMVK